MRYIINIRVWNHTYQGEIFKKISYDWVGKLLLTAETVDKKLNVVILPTIVDQYWRHPFGGLKVEKCIKCDIFYFEIIIISDTSLMNNNKVGNKV